MANWVNDFLERNPDMASLPVGLRDRYSIHFERGGNRFAHITGMPCHYKDENGTWQPLDTKLIPVSGGFHGAPGLDFLIHTDGRVKIRGHNYQHLNSQLSISKGYLDGDRIVREFHGGKQELILTEVGIREVITLEKYIYAASTFFSKKRGVLPSKFLECPTIATDAKRDKFMFRGDLAEFNNWLENASYPVIIDPDISEDTADGSIWGNNVVYATARSTAASFDITDPGLYIGQWRPANFIVYRSFLKFNAVIPGATVTQVNLKMTPTDDSSTTSDFDVQIVKQTWTDPIAGGNMDTNYDNCLSGIADASIWQNTAAIVINTQYSSGNLSTTWVKTDGTPTYYSLRSSRDKNGTGPGIGGVEYIAVGSANNGFAPYRPVLTVVYPWTFGFFLFFP